MANPDGRPGYQNTTRKDGARFVRPDAHGGTGFDHLPIWKADASFLRGLAAILLPVIAVALLAAAIGVS